MTIIYGECLTGQISAEWLSPGQLSSKKYSIFNCSLGKLHENSSSRTNTPWKNLCADRPQSEHKLSQQLGLPHIRTTTPGQLPDQRQQPLRMTTIVQRTLSTWYLFHAHLPSKYKTPLGQFLLEISHRQLPLWQLPMDNLYLQHNYPQKTTPCST